MLEKMVSLKQTSIRTAVIVKTLIVLTIIDHVFSNNEVEYCSKYIKELYSHSTMYHNQRIQDIGLTIDDESINDDLLKMFKKGFSVYNASEINLINIFIAAKSTTKFKDQFAKKTMTEKLKRYLQDFLRWMTLDDAEDIRKVNEYFAARLQSVLDTEELKTTVEKMNYYSYGYFKEFLNWVFIDDKESLLKPEQFCLRQFQERWVNSTVVIKRAADLCTYITKKSFNLSGDESGSQIFDIFYEKWTKNQIELVFFLEDERQGIRGDFVMAKLTGPEKEEIRGSEYQEIIDIYFESLVSFYNQFEDKLKDADVSQMQAPEDFCARIIGEASSSSYLM